MYVCNCVTLFTLQLALALADLALQIQWPSVVTDVISKLNDSRAKVLVLLEFLTVLPEEVILTIVAYY